MIVTTLINSKIERDFYFIKGKIKINSKYFIKKIEEGILESTNQNFNTNVVGLMTSYTYFNKDVLFVKTLLPIMDLIDSKTNAKKYSLYDSWGLKNTFSNYTKLHDHGNLYLSGVIYLNKSSQNLFFPEINETVESNVGNFAVFSSFLKHGTNKRLTGLNEVKYALSFNFQSK